VFLSFLNYFLVLQCRAELEDALALLNEEIWEHHHERTPEDPSHPFTLPTNEEIAGRQFVAKLLQIKPLPKEFQYRLLTTPGVEIPDEYCSKLHTFCQVNKRYVSWNFTTNMWEHLTRNWTNMHVTR